MPILVLLSTLRGRRTLENTCVLESSSFTIDDYLKREIKKINFYTDDVASLVVNCNPITKGHLYLIEKYFNNHNIYIHNMNVNNNILNDLRNLEDTLREIGLEDREFVRKVLANISADKKGYYLRDELFKIAENYSMEAMEIPFMKGHYTKKLTRK